MPSPRTRSAQPHPRQHGLALRCPALETQERLRAALDAIRHEQVGPLLISAGSRTLRNPATRLTANPMSSYTLRLPVARRENW